MLCEPPTYSRSQNPMLCLRFTSKHSSSHRLCSAQAVDRQKPYSSNLKKMDSDRKNKLKRKKLHQELVSHLRSQSWTCEGEMEEINASVSHWLQNPALSVPLFTNAMRNECLSYIHHSSSNQTGMIHENYVCEPQVTYQQRLKFLFDDVPYPPPATWDFTFIDLFAGIGGFRLAFQSAGVSLL